MRINATLITIEKYLLHIDQLFNLRSGGGGRG